MKNGFIGAMALTACLLPGAASATSCVMVGSDLRCHEKKPSFNDTNASGASLEFWSSPSSVGVIGMESWYGVLEPEPTEEEKKEQKEEERAECISSLEQTRDNCLAAMSGTGQAMCYFSTGAIGGGFLRGAMRRGINIPLTPAIGTATGFYMSCDHLRVAGEQHCNAIADARIAEWCN